MRCVGSGASMLASRLAGGASRPVGSPKAARWNLVVAGQGDAKCLYTGTIGPWMTAAPKQAMPGRALPDRRSACAN